MPPDPTGPPVAVAGTCPHNGGVDRPTDHLDELAAALTRPLRRGDAAAPHERPWRGPPGAALAVALPTDTEEVRTIVRWARAHQVRLLPQGAATGLVGASTPPPEGPAPLVVSTDALTARLEIDPVGATAVVSAGVRLSELNAAAASHLLELPVDLAADPALGAMVATNTGGSRVLRYGDMSRCVLGVEAVTATESAEVIGDVRALRKDNTGPDVTRLMVGSSGAFGILTAVAVALTPVPEERATALVGPLADTAALDLLRSLRASLGDRLSAFEVMGALALAAALAHMPDPPAIDAGQDPAVTVLVEASGAAGTEEALVQALARHGGVALDTARAVPPATAWAVRHRITESLRARGSVIGFDLSVRPDRLPALRTAVRELVAGRSMLLEVADFGHWGDGGVHCNVVVPHDVDLTTEEATELRRAVYSEVDHFGGSFSAEHGIGPLNAEQWLTTTPAIEREALTAWKQIVDPLGILGHPGLPL